MNASKLANTNVMVVGGAGFVGSNLVKRLLELGVNQVHVVDNLLSAEKINVPDHPAVRFSETSITDDALLASLQDEYDYVFHLATYHGNQSSIHDPLADHENNTLTTLKLYERLKHFKRLKKVVYSAAGCSIAEKTFDDAKATEETDIVSLHNNDSPYSMSKIFGEFYSVYYHKQHQLPTVRARFQNVYGPGKSWARAAGAARPPRCGATSRRPSSTRRSRGCPCRWRMAAWPRATSFSSRTWPTA